MGIPIRHQTISFIKSAVRLVGYTLLLPTPLVAAGYVLIVSELIGIWEEIGY